MNSRKKERVGGRKEEGRKERRENNVENINEHILRFLHQDLI